MYLHIQLSSCTDISRALLKTCSLSSLRSTTISTYQCISYRGTHLFRCFDINFQLNYSLEVTLLQRQLGTPLPTENGRDHGEQCSSSLSSPQVERNNFNLSRSNIAWATHAVYKHCMNNFNLSRSCNVCIPRESGTYWYLCVNFGAVQYILSTYVAEEKKKTSLLHKTGPIKSGLKIKGLVRRTKTHIITKKSVNK